MRNIRLAARTLVRTPIISIVAILSLALGIGANAAIFSLFNEMLLRPLPVPHPEALVNLTVPGPTPGNHTNNESGDNTSIFSYPMYKDLERLQTPFSSVAAFRYFGVNTAFHNQTQFAMAGFVNGGYFGTLGVRPALGRLIGPADDQSLGGSPVVVLGYAYWRTKLGGDTSVLNKTMLVNGTPMTIIGVAEEKFEGTTLGIIPTAYVPISMRGVLQPLFRGFAARRSYWVYMFARLKPGVTIDRAQGAMNAIFRPIVTEVEVPLQVGASVNMVERFKARSMILTDGQRGQSTVRTERRAPILLLFGITGVVLLIACANIANLLLARGANRSTEMAVRLALGATRRQLLTQLITESLVLAVVAGLLSVVVARATLDLFMILLPARQAATLHFSLNGQVLLFAAALTVGTGLLFGLFPALHATRSDLITSIRSGVGKHSGGRAAARFRSGLVTGQIALSMSLLILAGLFVKSLHNLTRVDLGFDTQQVVTFQLSPALNGYARPYCLQLFERIERELSALPGVKAVTATGIPLVADNNSDNSVSVQGLVKPPDMDDDAHYNQAGPGYFHTMNIPILQGRDFTEGDVVGSPNVAIVNEAFAEKFHMGKDVAGKLMGTHMGDTLDIQIVGLVKNTAYSGVRNNAFPIYVLPYRQDSTIGFLTFYVHTSGNMASLMRQIPVLVASIDPNLPVQELKPMPQQVQENIFVDRMVSTLSAAFATLATLLAAIGLYGVLAYSVAQRTREIGVRMALGADVTRVRVMVLRQVGWMALVGSLFGIAAAIMVGRYASSLLFQLAGFDVPVTVIAAVVLGAVAFVAGYLPARKASLVEPTQALRYE